jgi:hypothetical protein
MLLTAMRHPGSVMIARGPPPLGALAAGRAGEAQRPCPTLIVCCLPTGLAIVD